MARREYRIVTAPERPKRRMAGKDEGQRFAATLEEQVNEMAADGWSFERTETLTYSRRKGLFRRIDTAVALLVFARDLDAPDAEALPDHDMPPRRPRVVSPALRATRDRRPEGPKLVGPTGEDQGPA